MNATMAARKKARGHRRDIPVDFCLGGLESIGMCDMVGEREVRVGNRVANAFGRSRAFKKGPVTPAPNEI
jgi:hypothetical protein